MIIHYISIFINIYFKSSVDDHCLFDYCFNVGEPLRLLELWEEAVLLLGGFVCIRYLPHFLKAFLYLCCSRQPIVNNVYWFIECYCFLPKLPRLLLTRMSWVKYDQLLLPTTASCDCFQEALIMNISVDKYLRRWLRGTPYSRLTFVVIIRQCGKSTVATSLYCCVDLFVIEVGGHVGLRLHLDVLALLDWVGYVHQSEPVRCRINSHFIELVHHVFCHLKVITIVFDAVIYQLKCFCVIESEQILAVEKLKMPIEEVNRFRVHLRHIELKLKSSLVLGKYFNWLTLFVLVVLCFENVAKRHWIVIVQLICARATVHYLEFNLYNKQIYILKYPSNIYAHICCDNKIGAVLTL